jgi:hypothetical protein
MQYRGARLDRSVAEFHRAVDLLAADTVPESYLRRVQRSQQRRTRAIRPAVAAPVTGQAREEVRPRTAAIEATEQLPFRYSHEPQEGTACPTPT